MSDLGFRALGLGFRVHLLFFGGGGLLILVGV